MTLTFTPLTVAILIAITPFSGVAFAQTTKTPATAPATLPATTAPVTIQSPTEWISLRRHDLHPGGGRSQPASGCGTQGLRRQGQ